MKLNKNQLSVVVKSIIKEEVQKFQRRALLENEKRKLMEELGVLEESGHYDSRGNKIYGRMSDLDYREALGSNYNEKPYELMNFINGRDKDPITIGRYSSYEEAEEVSKKLNISHPLIWNANSDW